MKRIGQLARSFGKFWYGFIIGDDWSVAVAVLVMIGVVYALRQATIVAWWAGPVAVLATATLTVHRGVDRRMRENRRNGS